MGEKATRGDNANGDRSEIFYTGKVTHVTREDRKSVV